MSIQPEDVRHIAGLARLRLDDGEVEAMRHDLDRIIGHVDGLQTLGAHPRGDAGFGAFPEPVPNPSDEEFAASEAHRADAPDPLSRPPEATAPRWEKGFFVVPPPRGVNPEGA